MVEIVVVIAIMATLMGLATGPFMKWLRSSKLEDAASQMHETVKWAQVQAQKTGDADVKDGSLVKQRVYFAVKESDNSYMVVRWIDGNSNNLMTSDEFTVLQKGALVGARFGLLGSINKKGCGNSSGAPASAVVNLNASVCPGGIDMFEDYRCTRFDSRGFLTEGMQNIATYITDGTGAMALEINPAGITTLCRWSGSAWVFVR